MIESFDDVFSLLAESGGYALIVGLQIVLPFLLMAIFLQWYMRDRSKRMDAREEMERALSQEREAQLRRDYEEQLSRGQLTHGMIARMNDRYDNTLNKVTEAFGENSAVLRQAKDEMRHNSEVVAQNTILLMRLLPKMSKRTIVRKPVSIAMQAAEKTVESAQATVAVVEASEAKELDDLNAIKPKKE